MMSMVLSSKCWRALENWRDNMSTDSKEKKLPKGIRRRKSGLYEARFTYKGELSTVYTSNLKLLQSVCAEN